MSSVHRHSNSPFLQAHFRVWNGRKWIKATRSTKTADKDVAEKMAATFERAALAAGPDMVEARMLEVVESLTMAKQVEWGWDAIARAWLDLRAERVKSATRASYSAHVRNFARWADNGDLMASRIDAAMAQGFYNYLIKSGRSGKTAKNNIKTLAMVSASAVANGKMLKNPFAHVERVFSRSNEREPFSMDDVGKLIEVCDDEVNPLEHGGDWKTMILIGLCTGARLGDCKSMCFENIQKVGKMKVLAFSPEKKRRKGELPGTGRKVTIPLIDPLKSHIEGLPFDSGPLCPSLVNVPIGARYGISDQFRAIVDQSGIPLKVVERIGKGNGFRSKTFHSFRHMLSSQLMNAGVPQEWRMRILDHESAAVNEGYSHADVEAMGKWMERLSF